MPESYKEDGRPAQQWYWDDWFSAFDVRLCSVGARGVWIDMLGIMYKAEIRGTLTINGRQADSKILAKIVGETIANINKYLKELEDQDVFSRLEDNTIICRRMFRESGRKDQISKIRSMAGKKGAETRWQSDSKDMAKMAASTSSPTPIASPSSKANVELQKEIIDFFNETTNQKRSYTCDGTNKLINGRLGEGRTIDDFKHVIDTKYTQWRNDEKMSQFIRPSTLFRPENFENYLNEPYEKPKKKILKVGESTHTPSEKEDDYTKARAIKMKEVEKKYQPEVDKAMKAKSSDWMDEIDNKMKEEIAEFSREYHKKDPR